MFSDFPGRAGRAAALLLFGAIVYGPLLALVAGAFHAGPGGWELAAPLGRRGPLLGASVLFAGVVAAGAMALAVPAASVAGGRPILFRCFVVAMVALPPYVHTLAWSPLLAALRSAGFFGAWGAWAASAWVQCMASLPIAFCLALLSLGSVDGRLLDAARLNAGRGRVLWRVVMPLAAPGILASAALIFLLALVDYSVPSLYSAATYALEIFAEFSGSAEPSRALWLALPLMLAAGLAAAAAVAPLRAAATRRRQAPWTPAVLPAWWQASGYAAAGVVAGQALLALAALLEGASGAGVLWQAAADARRELTYSLLLAAAAAAIAAPLSLVAAKRMAREARAAPLWWALAVLPLAIPAPLIGVGLIALWNRPAGDAVYGTAIMPLLAALARFLPVAALLEAAFLRRVDPLPLEASRIFQRGRWEGMLRVSIPMHAPGLLASAGIVFALTLGELGATLIVAPPGRATLAMRIYNYLHYGASETVAALCLLIAAGTLAGGWLLVFAVRKAARGA